MNRRQAESCGTKRRLLLVDPDPLLRWSVKTQLLPSFDVVAVESVEQAKSVLAQQAFDAIVLSAGLGEDAQGLVTSARACHQGVTVVWLTTGSEWLERDASAAYIEKPFRLNVLAAALAGPPSPLKPDGAPKKNGPSPSTGSGREPNGDGPKYR